MDLPNRTPSVTGNSRLVGNMRRKLLLGSGLVVLSLAAWLWFGPLHAWRSIERVPFDPTAARQVLAEIRAESPAPQATSTEAPVPIAAGVAAGGLDSPTDEPVAVPPASPPTRPSPPPPPVEAQITAAAVADIDLDVFLILGSDQKPADPDIRADTILLLLVPADRSSSMLVSIPRLLYITSPCTGQAAPININLEGCGEVSGLDLMGVAVEDYTGLIIDHLVLFDFAGFETIIDRIGGLEVCVENPVKIRQQAPVFLEPGCSTLGGGQALNWIRQRQMLEQVDGVWQLMQGAGDAGRTQRQRDMVRQVIGKADQFESPTALTGLVSELSDSFALDAGFGLGEALDLAWELRNLGRRPAHDLSIATTGAVSPAGELVLIPDRPFSEYLEVLAGSG